MCIRDRYMGFLIYMEEKKEEKAATEVAFEVIDSTEIETDDVGNPEITNVEKPDSREIRDPFYLGHSMALCYINHNPLFTIGPHWPFYLCFNTFLGGLAFACLYVIILKISPFGALFGLILLLLQAGSYFYTFIVNPGIPDRNLAVNKENLQQLKGLPRTCPKCKLVALYDTETKHCNDCGICVEYYDHHCPWTGKCIGKNNVVSFRIFITLTAFLLIYIFVVTTSCLTELKRIEKHNAKPQ
eukprot:TRINITY_DN1643_c0_g1_i1.p2 TRINITY_DN1643_c0_g1~~TRINITY_DN1643_c0_g1_i1.p2  ORF type:complete len:242 (-),score=32.21 TRINITY_DN1643_c0_g1_i1:28-753(-)